MDAAAPLIVACLLYVGFAISVPNYLTGVSQQQLMRDVAEPGLLAIAMAVAVLSGGIDLSIGATFAVANLAALYFFRVHGMPLEIVTLIALGLGLTVGAINGLLIAVVRTKPFLTTLAVMIILRAGYEWLASENSTELAIAMHTTPGWQFLGSGFLLGAPTNMVALLIVAAAMHFFVTRVRPGLHIMAVGSSPRAARNGGIKVRRTLFAAYLLSGSIAALAGLFYAARQNSAGSDTGVGLEIAALTAVMVGGISLAGGRGTIVQAVLGAVVTYLLLSGFLRMGLPGALISSLSGAILIAAMLFSGLLTGRNVARRGGRDMRRRADPPTGTKETAGLAIDDPITLELRAAGKAYGGIHVLEDIDFLARPGEIHALMGENGAGKSTMSKIISGDVPLSSGSLLVNGESMRFSSPAESISAGISMVYQETSLIPSMTAAQNMVLGQEPLITRFAELHAAAQSLLDDLEFDVDATARVDQLGTARRQMVEIARAVWLNARVIIFDEPTGSLTAPEIEQFLGLMKRLRSRGVTVIFITHALEEALSVSDRITVLRDGRLVTSAPAGEFDRKSLVRHMVGRDVEMASSGGRSQTAMGDELFRAENLNLGDIVRGASFSLRAGEVVGFAGLVGSGRTEIAKLASGIIPLSRFSKGRVLLRGRELRRLTPSRAIADGVVYITEDRKIDGFFETMNIDGNIYLSQLASPRGWRWFYSKARSTQVGDHWINELSILAADRSLSVTNYSGGNQQKVVVAKALAQQPDVIFFDEPTRGVDVGAIPQIHAVIRQLADTGKAVVVISSYLPEVIAVSDRILVVREGEIVLELPGATATPDDIINAALGSQSGRPRTSSGCDSGRQA